jgi:CheY-like chemotaxis protein
VQRFLAANGAEVIVATSADEALEIAASAKPHVLVSDIGLPGVDGYEMLQRMRKLDSGGVGGIPAIAITAYARAEDRMLAFRAGYQVHLSKPVEPAELVDAIAKLMRSSGAAS